MKWYTIVCIFSIVFCVRESGGFKLLKKLKEVFHPAVSTTTIVPLVPEYENQHGHGEDDSRSWEQEVSTQKTKTKYSNEDLSTSQSSEKDGGGFISSNNQNNNVNYKPSKTQTGYSVLQNTYTTTTSDYGNAYDNTDQKQFTLGNNYDNRQSRTTVRYDQSDVNENYPGQSSLLDGFNKQEVKSTTPTSYDFNDQNEQDQSYGDIKNQITTTTRNYEETFLNTLDQAPSFGGVSINEIFSAGNSSTDFTNQDFKSTTTTSYGFNEKNQRDKLPGQEIQTSTARNYDASYNEDTTVEGTSIADIFSGAKKYSYGNSDNDGSETTTQKLHNSQYPNYDYQSSIFNNSKKERPQSTTHRSNDVSYTFSNPQSPSSGSQFNGQSGTSSKNNKHQSEQSSYNSYNNEVSTTTRKYTNSEAKPNPTEKSYSENFNNDLSTTPSTYYGNTNYGEVQHGISSTYNNDLSDTLLQGGNEQTIKSTSEAPPSYSTSKGSNQTKYSTNDEGDIIFPDNPSLNPTPEPERSFERSFQNRKGVYNKKSAPAYIEAKVVDNKTPAPVTQEEERRILDVPDKKCGPGEVLDKQQHVCKALARK